MVAMGMNPTTTTTTPAPELPDFLTSTQGPEETPIDDIDLPDYVPVIQGGPSTTTTPKPEEGTYPFIRLKKYLQSIPIGMNASL